MLLKTTVKNIRLSLDCEVLHERRNDTKSDAVLEIIDKALDGLKPEMDKDVYDVLPSLSRRVAERLNQSGLPWVLVTLRIRGKTTAFECGCTADEVRDRPMAR